MANDYPIEEPKPMVASDRITEHGTVAKQTYQIISDKEIVRHSV